MFSSRVPIVLLVINNLIQRNNNIVKNQLSTEYARKVQTILQILNVVTSLIFKNICSKPQRIYYQCSSTQIPRQVLTKPS